MKPTPQNLGSAVTADYLACVDKVQPPLLPDVKRKRNGRRLLFFTLGFFLVLVVAWAIYLGYLTRQENRLRAECETRHEPLTMDAIAALYAKVQDEDNAAVALIELWEEEDPTFGMRFKHTLEDNLNFINEIPVEFGKPADWLKREDITPAEWKALDEYLESLETRRSRLFAALARPECRFPLVFNDGPHMRLPHTVMLKMEGNRLAFDVIRALHSNQVDRAVTDLTAMSSLARHLAHEPLTVSQLVSCAIYRQTLEMSAHLLSLQRLSASQLAELRQACSWFSFRETLPLAIQCERAFTLSMYSLSPAALQQMVEPEAESRDATGYLALLYFARITGGKQADSINLLKTFRAADTLVKGYSPGSHTRWDGLFTKQSWSFPPKFFSQMMLPALNGLIYRHLDTEVAQRSLLAAFAIESFRGKSGKLPASLADIQSANPELLLQDPYQQGLLHYKTLEPGYVIYSVGRDGVDNDAQAAGSKGMKHPAGDLPFTVAR